MRCSINGVAMSIRDAYTDWATSYDTDRNLTRDLDQAVTRRTLSGQRFARILEAGCGTGKNTPFYAEIGQRVYALDFSEGMIRQAQAKMHHDNVRFAVADLTEAWPCASQSVDLATCNLVLEHIADLPAVFAEAHRVLKERGQFFVCELHPFKQYVGKKATFTRDQQATEIPAFVHHISDFLSAAESTTFTLRSLKEWWHETDQPTAPRLVSFVFEKH
jgi:ubiquinone/menaquinone biosynthesis C-methylase UbiE